MFLFSIFRTSFHLSCLSSCFAFPSLFGLSAVPYRGGRLAAFKYNTLLFRLRACPFLGVLHAPKSSSIGPKVISKTPSQEVSSLSPLLYSPKDIASATPFGKNLIRHWFNSLGISSAPPPTAYVEPPFWYGRKKES